MEQDVSDPVEKGEVNRGKTHLLPGCVFYERGAERACTQGCEERRAGERRAVDD